METQQLILAVDDEESILKLLRVNLALDGYEVVTASNGELALELLDEHRPDLVLLDIMMPDLNGFQVLELIRLHSNIPVIILTARGEKETIRDALGLGADDYVAKPFSIQVLKARIQAKLRRAEAV